MSFKNPEWWELDRRRWRRHNSEGEYIWQDTQREKLYTAERRFKSTTQENIKCFDSIEEIKKYVNKLIKSVWLVRRWGKQGQITISESKKKHFVAWARKCSNEIHLSQRAWDKFTVLHELAHLLHPTGFGSDHGRYFARTLLELVGHEISSKARKSLKKQYSRMGVKSSPIPKYSEETKVKMRENGKRLIAELQNQKIKS